MDEVKRRVSELAGEVVKLRRDFHAHPELGFQEHRTASVVEDYLKGLGIPTRRVCGTGITGVIKGRHPGPVLLLRADLDALPVQEENQVPYRSSRSGVMHACGHDAHTAMLLVAARILSSMRQDLSGSVKLVFQPNEEEAGALPMIKEGVLQDLQVDAAVGIHVWSSLPPGVMGISGGAVMAGLEIFKISVTGRGGHTGYPEAAADPIIAAADIVQSAQRIQTREISLMKPTVIMFGRICGGTRANIIPDTVTLEGSVRTLHTGEGGEDEPMERLKALAEKVCAVHGCSCRVEWYRENIPLINNPELAHLAAAVARDVLGDGGKVISYASMASEDFSEFSARLPGVFIFLGCGNEEKECHYPHHNPRFNVDEDVLPAGVEMFVRMALSKLQTKEEGGGR